MSGIGPMLGYVALFYALLHAVDAACRYWAPFHYMHALHTLGLQISPLQLRWATERLNRHITRFGGQCPGLLRRWFWVGSVISTLLILPSVILLVQTLVGQIRSSSSSEDRLVIQPVLPGVNMPTSELGYYFLSLLICSVYHELGHAVAAVSENVRVLGFGVFLLAFVPAAFVDLPTEQLLSKTPGQRLRLFSAGVWHNLLLVGGAWAVLQLLPYPLSPLFHHQQGVCVTAVQPDSPVRGPSGLQTGDQIVSFNGQPLRTRDEFRAKILTLLQEAEHHGYCLANTTLTRLAAPSPTGTDCCPPTVGGDHICFAATGANYCLPVRELMTKTNATCVSADAGCSMSDQRCVVPTFGHAAVNTSTKLTSLGRLSQKDFLFVGNPAVIYATVSLSDYCPRYGWLAGWLPDCLLKMARYVASFSGALAVLNVVPCYMLDGQHMMEMLMEMGLPGTCFTIRRRRLQTTVMLLGSGLVVANIAVGFLSLVRDGPPHQFTS